MRVAAVQSGLRTWVLLGVRQKEKLIKQGSHSLPHWCLQVEFWEAEKRLNRAAFPYVNNEYKAGDGEARGEIEKFKITLCDFQAIHPQRNKKN